MFKKIKPYLPLSVLFVVAIACLSFSEVKKAGLRCTNVKINIQKNASHADFINEDDVYEMMGSNRNMLIGQDAIAIKIDEIEKTLEANPSVRACETYFTLDGTLCVDIQQRTPIIRVIANKTSYYIDETGMLMPLSHRGSARVLVASGCIDEEYAEGVNILKSDDYTVLKDIFNITQTIRKDEIFLPMIEQIYVTEKGEYCFGTKMGPSTIEFGDCLDSDVKFNHLKAFYKSNKVKENWDKYSSISVKYRNQIVCTKK